MVVTNASVSDDRPSPGGSATLSVTVRNVGAGAAAATTLRFYRSADQTITTADTEVGTHAVAELAPSGTGDGSMSLTAPSTAGTYYYGACVDTVTGESDTSNNCSSSVEITVVEPGPNLVVSSPSVSNNRPAAGATFTLSAAVRNDGDESAAATTLRFYRSTDATITTSDTLVGTDAVAELAASGSGSLSVDLTAPTTAGTYYYGACVDAVEGESDTADNCSSSVEITVVEPGPNLVVSSPSVSNSAPAAGTTITVSATVRNDGDEASAVTTMRFYRSTDATITTSDTEVGTDTVEGLAPSGTGSQPATSSSQPGRLASTEDSGTYYYHGELELNAPSIPGTYWFGACVDSVTDESDTTNNCSPSAQVTVLTSEQQVQGTPDLNPYTIVVSSGLDAVSPGGSFSLSVGVRNDGDGSSAATTLRYYRSTDATVTTSDTEVDTDDVPSLAPSATSTQSVNLTAPSTPGAYYYGACVDTVADESDTSNNCSSSVQVRVSEPKPDLAMRGWSTSVLLPEPGATFTLRGTVWNLGDKSSAATTLRWYRSTDATLTTSDTSEGTDAVAELAPSGNVDKTVELTAPTSVGTYYYGACVDAVNGESDTTNNCSSTQITVRDAHLVGIYSLSNAVTEGMSVRFRVTATPQPTVALAVNLKSIEYAVREGRISYFNWPPAETTLTIGAGSSSTTLTVGTIDDSDEDGNSVLQASVSNGSGYTRDPRRSLAEVAVVDDDGPAGDSVLSITPVSTPVTEGTAAQFTMSANPAPAAAVTIGYRVWEDGSILSESLDPGWNPGTVTIGAGQTSATLSFGTVNDSTDEEDGEVTVTLIVDTYPDGVELGRPAEASVTVLDDD